MVIEYVRYLINDEAVRVKFLAAYGEAAQWLDASAHCLHYDLAQCHEEPERFTLRIHWDSLDGHLQGFRRSAEFQKFLAAVRPFIEHLEEMQHYNCTELRSTRTIYAAVGGVDTFFKLARAMHEEMVADAVLGAIFGRAVATHVPHLAMWLCEVFGGPKLYSETLGDIAPMLSRHASLDIQEPQRASFVACARRAVDRVIPNDEQEAANAIMRYVEWGTHVAVENSRVGHRPDATAGVPTWHWNSAS